MVIEHDSVSGKYIFRIDPSVYKEMDCLRYIFYKLVQGYSLGSVTKNPILEYGTAGHKFLQARFDGKSFEEQLAAAHTHFGQPDIIVPENEWRNIGHLTNTLVNYDLHEKTYGTPLTGVATEMRFMYPFYRTDKVEVLICGTVDLRAIDRQQGPVIVDHKFTSAWNKDEYFREYDLSVQLMIYKWICDKLFDLDYGCMINGIFISKTKPASFQRSDVFRYSPYQIQGCMNHLMGKVVEIVRGFEVLLANPAIDLDTVFPPNYCACVKRYGEKASPCIYTMVCKQPTSEEMNNAAKAMFEQKRYDPMLFQLVILLCVFLKIFTISI